MSSPAKIQTVSEASSSISDVVQSSFANLANMLGLSQLKDSFFQNIIYILIMIVIFIGILVYIQMVGSTGNDPLNSPPTKEIKKVEIQKIVEGFAINDNYTNSIADGASTLETDDYNNNHNNNNNHNDEHDIHLSHVEHYVDGGSNRKKKH
jgi:hypothetical protein